MPQHHKGHREALNVKSDLSNKAPGLKTKVHPFIISNQSLAYRSILSIQVKDKHIMPSVIEYHRCADFF